MLCVSRVDNESVTIGKAGDVLTEPITITVKRTTVNQVRLGVHAQVDNESVTIGKAGDMLTEPITITVKRTTVNQVRLGVHAQADIRIERSNNVADCRADRTPEIERGDD